MRRLLISSLAVSALFLSGCETTRLFKRTEKNTTPVCSEVNPPTEEALSNFTFFPLPSGTTAEGGVPLVAGLTADGMVAIVGNLTKLKKREIGWQARAKSVNNCLAQEAKDREKIDGRK